MNPIRPVVLTIPGLLVTAYACELSVIVTSTAGAGFSASTSQQTEHRTTLAKFLSSGTPKWVDEAWNESQACGSSTIVETDVLATPVFTTSLQRTITTNPFDYTAINSNVIGDGWAVAEWRD